MTTHTKRGALQNPYPIWLRALALACLLLVAGMSSVQAVHVHGQWLPQQGQQAGPAADGSQGLGGEDHCPLCVAMHWALPVATHVVPARALLVECKLVQGVDRAPEAVWHFAMFSRPPPIQTL